ncbi:MAG: LytTR family DNA-binding domain-containing protein [Saprospiraceae bacterium]
MEVNKRLIIIEDEDASIDLLIAHLSSLQLPISIEGIAKDTTQALALIETVKPDIILLDIMLQEEHLLDKIRATAANESQIIIISGYTEFALQAIDLDVVAYLVKPIDSHLFTVALQKAIHKVNANDTNCLSRKIIVKSNTIWKIINEEEILYAEAAKGYTVLYLLDDSKIVISRNIGEVNELLSEKRGFMRIHKSYIANLMYISAVNLQQSKSEITLRTDTILPFAFRRRDELNQMLSKLPCL